jgi:hypothetical protein
MKKIIIFFISLILILGFIFDKKIIEFVLTKNLSNNINFKLNFKINKINYFSQQIEILDLKIKNKKNYFNENVFEVSKVLIDYNLASVFTDLVVIKSVFLAEPKFYFEILDDEIERNQKENLKDNVDLIKTFNNQNPKIYPKKNKDKNFIINNVKINNSFAYIKAPQNKKNIKINLSNMSFQNVGNANKNKVKNIQHFKDTFKIILMDIYFKIPDQNLKELLKKNYKIN